MTCGSGFQLVFVLLSFRGLHFIAFAISWRKKICTASDKKWGLGLGPRLCLYTISNVHPSHFPGGQGRCGIS